MPPRLLVPGRIDVVVLDDGRGFIERGLLADVPPAVPAQEDLEPGALVPVQAAPEPPGAGLELDAHPFVRAQLQRLRWVLVSRDVGRAVREAGHPILQVQGGRAGAHWFAADGSERSVEAADPVLWRLILGEEPDADVVHRWAETGALQDRIVHALTGGAVSLRDLELARWAAELRPDRLRHEEAILAEIHERAVSQEAQAEALLAALDGADPDQVEVPVPVYERARRVVDAAFILEDSGAVRVKGGPLHVPESVVFEVDGVQPWEPSAAGERRASSFADWHERIHETRRRGKRRELVLWGGLGVALLAALTLALGARLYLQRVDTDAVSQPTDTPATGTAPDPSR